MSASNKTVILAFEILEILENHPDDIEADDIDDDNDDDDDDDNDDDIDLDIEVDDIEADVH